MLHVFTGLMALYLLWRLVWCLKWPVRHRVLVSVVFLVITQYQLFNRWRFGSLASPEWPSSVLVVSGWLFGSMMVATALIGTADVVRLLWRSLQQWRTVSDRGPGGATDGVSGREAGGQDGPTRKLLRSAAGLPEAPKEAGLRRVASSALGLRWGLAVAAMLLAAFGVREAIRVPDVRTVEVVLPGLPEDMDGMRLVQLTDLHASRLLQGDWMSGVVAAVNALEPDLVVLTGDLADGSVQARQADIEPLAALRAPLGVYAIPGNHEYYTEYQPWIRALHGLGLHLLLNDHVRIRTEGGSLVIAGITDVAASRYGETLPNLASALQGVEPSTPVILLSHRPLGAKGNAHAGVSLQLSGHTHGGQILGMHWITQWANQGYVSGLYKVGDMQLYVSNGTGLWNGLPVRLGRPSEITQIVLRAKWQRHGGID